MEARPTVPCSAETYGPSSMHASQNSTKVLGSRITSGLVWSVFSIAVGKGASLIAQLILGWLLSKEDFALYAIAISWSTIVMALRNGGTQRLLIQKGTQYADLAVMYLKFALLFNVGGFAILMAAAPILSGLYDSHALQLMVWILGLSLPLSTAAMIFQAKLSADLEFAKVSRLIILSSLARHGSMVVFAWLGLGPLSFVLPLCVVALVETALGWYWAKCWPPSRSLPWPAIRGIFQDSRWVMITALASALTINGDYLAISLLQSKELLGVYFFGYQLSLALVALVTSSLDTVMMPTFSALGGEPSRQTELFMRGMRLLAVASTFACFGLALAAPALIHGLWAGKWDEAIPVVQILSLAMPVRLMIPLCRAMLEARGQWRLVSVLSICDGVGIILAGAIGAWAGGLILITAVVSGYNLFAGLLYCAVVARMLPTSFTALCAPALLTLCAGLLAVTLGAGILMPAKLDPFNPAGLLISIPIYAASYFLSIRMLMGNVATELRNVVMRATSARLT